MFCCITWITGLKCWSARRVSRLRRRMYRRFRELLWESTVVRLNQNQALLDQLAINLTHHVWWKRTAECDSKTTIPSVKSTEVESLCFGVDFLVKWYVDRIEGLVTGECSVKSWTRTSYSQPEHWRWVSDGCFFQQQRSGLKKKRIRVSRPGASSCQVAAKKPEGLREYQ